MIRSALFVPADNPRALAKTASLRPDAFIFDLEDAVGPHAREGAVATLLAHLNATSFGEAKCLVRLPKDLDPTALLATGKVDGIVVPKVAAAEDVTGFDVPVWAMIETPQGVANIANITASGVAGLIAGPNDLRAALRSRPLPDRQDIAFALSQIVLHARAHGIAALDGVYNAYRDAEGFVAECEHGRALGFDGKTLIHPSQIDPANVAFGPSKTDLDWARAVVAAFEAQPDAGVLSVSGEMVERLHLETARRWLSKNT